MTKKGHFSGKRRMPTLPTATKEQKVQKIRNAEYYDFQGVHLHSHHGRFIDPRPITYTHHLWRAFLALGNSQR